MSNVENPITALPAIGEALGGGFFAGTFLLNDRVHVLIAAPKAEGETKAGWCSKVAAKTPACSLRDGLSNSEAINDDNHPAAKFCRSLTIGDFTDWYLPSRHEAALLAENLTPEDGHVPAQTTAESFKKGGAEAFETDSAYWTSTEWSPGYAWYQYFNYGFQYDLAKGWGCRVRAVRKYPL